MKTELGITSCDWLTEKTVATENRLDILITSSKGEWIGWLYTNKEGSNANAKLIADAGTTANATGLLPSELLAQRDELRDLIAWILDNSTRTKIIEIRCVEILNKTK